MSLDDAVQVDYDDALRSLIWTLPEDVQVSRTPSGVWDLRRGDERLCIAQEFGDDGRVTGWVWTEYTAASEEGEWDTADTGGEPLGGWHQIEQMVRELFPTRWVRVRDMRPGDRVVVNGIIRTVVSEPYPDRWVAGRFNVGVETPDYGGPQVLWGDGEVQLTLLSEGPGPRA